MDPIDGTGTALSHPFDTDTAVRPIAEGVYAARITERWNRLGGGPNGGYLFATCLQALARATPFADPLVACAFFLRPGEPGEAEIATELVRAGRRSATGQARLIQRGKERVRVLSTFTRLAEAEGRTVIFGAPPGLPPPDDCLDPLAGRSLEGVTIADRVEYRMARPPGWLLGKPSGRPSTELWARFKEAREPDLISLPLMADAAAPAVLELGELGSSTLELTVHLRARPAPGWLACRVATRYVIDGYHEEDFEIWDSGGRLVAQARQLALLPRSAEATKGAGN
jgi:acyl-CoA thioesterase